MKYDRILLGHGGGGLLTNELIEKSFLPFFKNECLERLEDGAVFDVGGVRLCLSTDSYVVNPIFFPGGDIGSLAVHGTVNDVSMCGARPLYISVGFIIEEGFEMESLEKIIASMAEAAKKAGVQIVTGDTKVVSKGSADKIFINTSGLGIVEYKGKVSSRNVMPGDAVIVNGTIGDHGAAIMALRLGIDTPLVSDSAALNSLVQEILKASGNIHCMRDATRGGLGAILSEIAAQSGTIMRIDETAIPVKEEVNGVCEILGLDAVYLANEGKMVVFCPEAEAEKVLSAMKKNAFGIDAAIIGRVESKAAKGRVIMNTVIGGQREIDLPPGELLPRIC